MAARKTSGVKHLSEAWKERIRSGVLAERLERCAMGDVEMTTNQIRAAQILMNKVIPDIARTELSGPDGGPIVVSDDDKDVINRFAPKVK
jgi:hypothetical protein